MINRLKYSIRLLGTQKVGNLLELEILDADKKREKVPIERWDEMKNNKKEVPCGDKKRKRSSGVGVDCELNKVTGGPSNKNIKKGQENEMEGSSCYRN